MRIIESVNNVISWALTRRLVARVTQVQAPIVVDRSMSQLWPKLPDRSCSPLSPTSFFPNTTKLADRQYLRSYRCPLDSKSER
jgi:hypothetical protein